MDKNCSSNSFNSMKRLAFSEPFMSQRRKVVSGFSLGLGASLLFLTLLFLNTSLIPPKVQVFLQGSGSAISNSSSSSVYSWSFSIRTKHPFASSSVANNNDASLTVSSPQRDEERIEETRGVNASSQGLNKNTRFANFTVGGENATLNSSEVQQFPLKSNGENVTLVTEIGNFTDNRVVKDVDFAANATVSSSSSGESNVTSVNNNNNNNNSNNDNVTVVIDDGGSSLQDVKMEGRFSLNDENCDIYDGMWIRDDSKPYYPLGSCPLIDRDFDCHLNGRPDSDYVKWKWQPHKCDIPSLNATNFLERLRGQRLVFVGDSLNRNMWESMVCILRQSVKDKKRVFEISGRHEFKKKGVYAFRFEDYNCSVDFVSSPFIVRESTFKGINGSFETLRLDLMDQTTTVYHDADIIVFNTGHWWTHEKTSKGEDYYQEGNHVYPRLKVLDAFRRALTTWARWVDKNIDANRTQVVFRGYSNTHFRGGQWNSGGQCHKETEPIYNTTHLKKYPSKMRALDNVIIKMKTPVMYMNISRLTDYRKDGHPSIYRMEYKTEAERAAAELHQDCSHWCLPGVPDTWNELLYASLLKSGRGSWKS
ncbi:hypothetical protein AHAS_Ahas05G0090600 [Arachis hypogaea]